MKHATYLLLLLHFISSCNNSSVNDNQYNPVIDTIRNSSSHTTAVYETGLPDSYFDTAFADLKKDIDEVNDVAFYSDRSTPNTVTANNMQLYIARSKGNELALRLRICYTAEDWLFINRYIFKCDNERFFYTPIDFKHDNSAYTVAEWSDEEVKGDLMSTIFKVVSSNKVILRSEGSTYYKDRTISTKELKAMLRVYNKYTRAKKFTAPQ